MHDILLPLDNYGTGDPLSHCVDVADLLFHAEAPKTLRLYLRLTVRSTTSASMIDDL